MSALPSLLETLRAAPAGSVDLDRAIWQGFGSPVTASGLPSLAGLLGIGSFTTDIQHALKLANSVLPNLSSILLETYVGGSFHHCEIESDEGDASANNAPTLALAVVIATVELLASTPRTKGCDR